VLVAGGHGLVHQVVASLLALADQAALGAVEVDEYLDVEGGVALLGGIEGGEDLPSRLVILQVEGDQVDALGRMGDERQDPALEVLGAAEHLKLIRGDRDLQLSIMCR